MSIDDAQPAEWDNLHRDNALGKSYSKIINTTMADNVNHPPH